ncbi:MAG TPA: UPF0158 family protein [Anaerolineae bacterium]|nr:UPF0158 family protein [Anaerolineae bacterium]HOQ97224.1 UPF0158 family protein [Anaerolineae bacterium]HPL26449.1 UPF0158 family protein [Anaerolineae bacterium]
MLTLKVNLAELESAFEMASFDSHYFLDLETGEVIWVSGETFRELEWAYETEDEAEEGNGPMAGLPEWRAAELRLAEAIERDPDRYLAVPEADSHEAWEDMADFVGTVTDERLRRRLLLAIEGSHPFRRFKDVLAGERRTRDRWFEFQDARARQRVLEWLADEGIEPVLELARPAESEPPAERGLLIAEALAFVQAASKVAGVQRIALLGSLTTDEPDLDDVDLLVTVADEMDLAPLAALARRMQGHAQSFGRGADVFLADPRGNYLGRTCPWRECRPGIRMGCNAEHCGRRQYLHDDLRELHLATSLVLEPPLELWPRVAVRVPVPGDVQEGLIDALRR